MRHILLACVLLTTGCASGQGGGSLIPIKAVGTISGDSSGPQVFIAGVPMNALLKIHGNVTYSVQPVQPFVTLDGDWNYIIEPVPGMEVEAQNAVLRGDILIRHDGTPSTLNAPGSIAAYKETVFKAFYGTPKAKQNPPLPEPPPASPDAKPVGMCCDPTDPTSPCYVPTCSR